RFTVPAPPREIGLPVTVSEPELLRAIVEFASSAFVSEPAGNVCVAVQMLALPRLRLTVPAPPKEIGLPVTVSEPELLRAIVELASSAFVSEPAGKVCMAVQVLA